MKKKLIEVALPLAAAIWGMMEPWRTQYNASSI
jgi:hypothetical protein